MKQERMVEQVDKMVRAGRITKEEGERLRAAEGTDDFDAAVGAIRARHAGTHMELAIAAGEISREEADRDLERLRNGEHPKGLRARLRKHRPRQPSGTPSPAESERPTE